MKDPVVKNKINCMEYIWETRIEISKSSQSQKEIYLEQPDGILFYQPLKKKRFKFFM